MIQYLEFPQEYLGKTVTASILYGDVVYAATGTLPETLPPATQRRINTPFPLGSILVDCRSDFGVAFIIAVTPGSAGTVQAVKLELGNTSTLVEDAPPDFGAELAQCQRYCLVMAGGAPLFRASAMSSANCYFSVPTPQPLRAAPSVTGAVVVNTLGGAAVPGEPFVLSYSTNTAGLWVTAVKAGHGMTDAALRVPAGTVFSADLS